MTNMQWRWLIVGTGIVLAGLLWLRDATAQGSGEHLHQDLLDRLQVLEDIHGIGQPPPPPPPPTQPPPAQALADCIAAMGEGTWSDCGGIMVPLLDNATATAFGVRGNTGSAAVIGAWNDAAWDGDCMYLHGGGHQDYRGAEVYRFCMSTAIAERLNMPSPYTVGTFTPAVYPHDRAECVDANGLIPLGVPMPAPNQDGTAGCSPNPPHTYGGATWVPGMGFLRIGGYPSSGPGGDNWVDPRLVATTNPAFVYDPATNQWTYLGDMPQMGSSIVYDPSQQRVLVRSHSASQGQIYAFDPLTLIGPRSDPLIPVTQVGSVLGQPNTGGGATSEIATSIGKYIEQPWHHDFRLMAMQPDGTLTIEHNIKSAQDGAPSPILNTWGIAWDSARQKFVVWPGGRETWTIDPFTYQWTQYPNPTGVAPGSGNTIYGKWRYYAPLDVFVGINSGGDPRMWFYKPTNQQQTHPDMDLILNQGFACVDTIPEYACSNVQQAVDGLPAGSTLALARGKYQQCAVIYRPITIDGDGSIFDGQACAAKAAFVAEPGGHLTLRNLTCQNIGDHTGNLACVRLNAANLKADGLRCDDLDTCVLGTTTALNTRVELNGVHVERVGGASGKSHGVYVGRIAELAVRNSTFRCMVGSGHHIKTGADVTLVENSTLDGADCADSRLIDSFAGNVLRVTNSTLIESTADTNRGMIASNPAPAQGAVGPLVELQVTSSSFDCGAQAWPWSGTDAVMATWANNAYSGNCVTTP